MNERIKELHSKVISESENMRWNIEDSKRLVELIVRECVRHLNRRDVEGFGILEERNLLEYFGVDNETH